MKLSLKTASKSHRVLVFGPPKSGKTALVGQLASKFNLLWFDLENGADTLLQLPLDQQEKVELISLPDTRAYPIAIETCLKAIKGSKGTICETHGKWNCALCAKTSEPIIPVELSALSFDTIVVFDSLTQLTNSAIAHITKDRDDDYKLDYDDWAKLGKLMDTFLSHVQQAGYHVVCISHETEAEMEDGSFRLVPTAGTARFSRNTAKYFDEVIYAEVKNKKHVAGSSTLYSSKILTGSRSGTLLELQATPSLVSIFTGEKPTVNVVNQNTPANKALTGLAGLSARLKEAGK